MKHIEKTIKTLALAILSFSAITLTYSEAQAGCFGDSTLTAHEVKITPPSDCFDVTVTGHNCVESINIEFLNSCNGTLKVVGNDFEEDIISGTSRTNFNYFVSGVEEVVSYTATIEEASHDIEVRFTADYKDNDVGCSTTDTNPATFFFLLGFGLLFARRRHFKPSV